MESFLKEKVINQYVGKVPVENYLADLLVDLEKLDVCLEKAEMKIKTLKQLNNRHKNIIDAQRVMLKQAEFESSQLNI
jgi:hypothetical protein